MPSKGNCFQTKSDSNPGPHLYLFGRLHTQASLVYSDLVVLKNLLNFLHDTDMLTLFAVPGREPTCISSTPRASRAKICSSRAIRVGSRRFASAWLLSMMQSKSTEVMAFTGCFFLSAIFFSTFLNQVTLTTASHVTNVILLCDSANSSYCYFEFITQLLGQLQKGTFLGKTQHAYLSSGVFFFVVVPRQWRMSAVN